MGTHRCKWPGCATDIPNQQWACPSHWYRIPLGLRVKLNRSWQALGRVRSGEALQRASRLHGTAAAHAARDALEQYRAAEKAIFDWIHTPPAAR